MTSRRGHCDVAFFIDNKATLEDVYHIMDSLDDAGIYADYSTLAFCLEGLYFEAKTDIENIENVVNRISYENHLLLHIDWDTMCDWEPIGEGDWE